MRLSPLETSEAIHSLLRLRHLEQDAESSEWADLAAIRGFIETVVGPTVRRADAARLLGLSRPALKRWIDSGEISTVLTPDGGIEVPVSELLDLLEDVEQHRAKGGRPVSRAIRERKRQAAESVDIDRLLPRRRRRDHRVPELQSLAYHRLVAERLDGRLVADARQRLGRWCASGAIHPTWAERWQKILSSPIPEIAKTISSDSKTATALRQTSPFAGVLNEQERRRLVQAVEERALA